MRRITAWFVIFSMLAFTGMNCEKESLNESDCNGNCYIIQGKVIDSLTLKGIPNVSLAVIQDSRPFGSFSVKSSTNALGEYKIIFDGKRSSRNDNYYLEINSLDFNYHPGTNKPTHELDLNLEQAKYDVPVVKNISLLKPGTIKLHVKSDNVVNFYTLTFDYDYGRGHFRKYIKGRKKVDTMLIFTTASGIKTNIKWSENTLSQFGQPNFDTVTVSGPDTLNYNLKVN